MFGRNLFRPQLVVYHALFVSWFTVAVVNPTTLWVAFRRPLSFTHCKQAPTPLGDIPRWRGIVCTYTYL